MATRFSYDKSDTTQIQKIMELYLSKSRAQLATDVLLMMYANQAKHGDKIYTRQYMLAKGLKNVPKSNIQEVLEDLLRIRAIRNMGAKGTISLYKPTLNELGTALKQHSTILKSLHERLTTDYKPFLREAKDFKENGDDDESL